MLNKIFIILHYLYYLYIIVIKKTIAQQNTMEFILIGIIVLNVNIWQKNLINMKI